MFPVSSESDVWHGLLAPGPLRTSGPACLRNSTPAQEQEESQGLKPVSTVLCFPSFRARCLRNSTPAQEQEESQGFKRVSKVL